MDRTMTRRAALTLLGSGACLTLYGTFGSTAITAGRTTTLDVSSDAAAFLSIEKIDDASTVPELTNRTSYDMSVTLSSPDSGVEFDVGNDGQSDGTNPSFSLLPGDANSVEFDVLADGTIPVDVSADLLDGSGNPVGSITYQRDVEAQTQASQIQVTANVKSAGNSGKYEFELENTGSIDVTLVGIGVRETTNPNAEKVGGANGDDIFTAEGTQVVTSIIPVDSTDPDTDTRRDFTQDVSLDQGVTKVFEFRRFRTASNGNADMKNEEVGLTLYFDDGSSADKRLIP